MPSSQVLNFANWITIRLNYQVEIFNWNYFITQIMLSSQIAFVGVSLEIKKFLLITWFECSFDRDTKAY